MDLLLSYAFLQGDGKPWEGFMDALSRHSKGISLLLDSGAYTAYTVGHVIKHRDYAAFVKEWRQALWGYIQLDVMYNPPATLTNLRNMVEAGFDPLGVWTPGATVEDLAEIGELCKRVCLSGTQVIKSGDVWNQRAELARRTTSDEHWLHLLGMSRGPAAIRSTADSFDSSTWRCGQRFGHLMVFDPHTGCKQLELRKVLAKHGWNDLPAEFRAAFLRWGVTSARTRERFLDRGSNTVILLMGAEAWLKLSAYMRSRGKRMFLVAISPSCLLTLAAVASNPANFNEAVAILKDLTDEYTRSRPTYFDRVLSILSRV